MRENASDAKLDASLTVKEGGIERLFELKGGDSILPRCSRCRCNACVKLLGWATLRLCFWAGPFACVL